MTTPIHHTDKKYAFMRTCCRNSEIILQVLVQSSRLYEGQETLILTETAINSFNLSSAAEQGIFTGLFYFYLIILVLPDSRLWNGEWEGLGVSGVWSLGLI
jgi:hypothetical protein